MMIMKEDNWSEKENDDCLREFFHKTNDNSCEISEKCWNFILSDSQKEYGLTHQLFYLLVGIQSGCEQTIENLLELSQPKMNLLNIFQKLCSNILSEISSIEDQNFPVDLRDLFMEQIGFCGRAGFWEFCKLKWLNFILLWQSSETGCYHKFFTEQMNPKNFDPNNYGNYRRKRSETKLSIGAESCLAHRTSVALSALDSYLRYLIEFQFT